MLGRITGKTTTLNFAFELSENVDVRKFEYVKVPHRSYEWVLCQVVEIERNHERSLARCNIIGYKDDEGRVKQVRIPFELDTEVFLAEDEFITDIINLDDDGEKKAYIGMLDGKHIKVNLDLRQLLTKHVAVLAKSGAGKSYAVGVLIEEILEHKVPVVIIDPHGEYHTLARPNKKDEEKLAAHGLTPTEYHVREYGDPNEQRYTPLRLSNNLTQQELVHLLPGKLNNTQLGILYNAIRGLENIDFDSLLLALEQEESSAKWSIINLVEHLRSLGIFTNTPLAYNELVKSGTCSIINMRGIPPEIQHVIVYKIAKDLFALRKEEKVPPFFLVIEEAHNYCPERSFGETTSSKILRTIASEGRKFGLGLCVISQRPARVDKSVLSQCTTQILLKVTNPNDVKAVANSVEGLTAESEAEIQNLPVGTALVTGVVDMPLFVNIRPRRTQHGGHAVNILAQPSKEEDFLARQEAFAEQALLPLVKPRTSVKDLALMAEGEVTGHETILSPGYVFTCKEKEREYKIVYDLNAGAIVTDLEEYTTMKLPALDTLSPVQVKVLMYAHQHSPFTTAAVVKNVGAGVDVADDLADLEAKGYVKSTRPTEDGADDGEASYSVTQEYVLDKLSKHACYEPVAYEEISYTRKEEAVTDLDAVKAQLSKFTKVLDHQECNIVRYQLRTKE